MTGYNATLLAYGQTGSGKTYTMGTATTEGLLEPEWGMLPRAIRHLFRLKDERAHRVETTIRCAFLEILNEEVRDLLHPDTSSKNITIRERADGAILVSGISEEPCATAEDLERALDRGALCRATGSTRMNAASSRSHAIFTIIVEQRSLGAPATPGDCPYVNAKFHMVDLAGSERNKKTDATGQRFKEAVHINGGLLVLGNVINALCERDQKGGKGRQHVPYRDSKLTRLLQDSLGGNAKTCMVACVSTADSNMEETVNTLKYAERARAIRNRPHVNVDPMAAALAAVARGDGDGMDGYTGASVQAARAAQTAAEQREAEARAAAEQAQSQMSRLKADLTSARAALEAVEAEAQQYRAERDAARVELAAALSTGRISASESTVGSMDAGRISQSAAASLDSPSTPRMHRASVDAALRNLSDVESRLAAKEAALLKCEALLAEAQADLARDEVIFRDKLTEVKQLKKALRDALAELDETKSRAAAAEAEAAAAATAEAEAANKAAASGSTCPSCGAGMHGDGRAASLLLQTSAGDVADDLPRRSSAVAPSAEVELLERALAEKETERAALVAAKSRAEAAKMLAEADAERDAQEFARSRQAMLRQLREMEFAIARKEELIADLARNEEAARTLSARYEERMKDLETAVADREAEKERLRTQLDALDAAAAKANSETEEAAQAAKAARAAAEAKLVAANAQLATLRDAQKASAGEAAHAAQRALRGGETRSEALSSELQRMRTAQEQLRRRLALAAEQHAAESSAHARDLAAIKKEADQSALRVKELEAENARQRAVLQKRAEDVLAAQRRLRGNSAGQGGASSAGAQAPLEPAWWPGVTPQQLAARGAGAPAPPTPAVQRVARVSASPSTSRSGTPQPSGEWLSTELAALLRLREAQEEAASAASKRAAVAAEREAVAADKAALELRCARAVATLDASLAAAGVAIAQAEAASASLGAQSTSQQVASARQAVEDAYRQRAALEARKRGGIASLLSPADAALMEQLDDRLDALETQEGYLAAAAAEAAREARDAAEGAAAFHAMASSLGPNEARAALQQAADAAVAAAASSRRDSQRAAAAEAALAERERELTDTTAALARREMDYDRRVVELQKEHAKKMQQLLQQAAAVGAMSDNAAGGRGNAPAAAAASAGQASEASQLAADAAAFKEEQLRAAERDARYHKASAKELKRQLAESQAEKADVEAERESLAAQRDEAESMVATLMAELAHAKDQLRAMGRISSAGGSSAAQSDVPLPPPPPWLVPGEPAGGAAVRVAKPRVSAASDEGPGERGNVTRVLPPRSPARD